MSVVEAWQAGVAPWSVLVHGGAGQRSGDGCKAASEGCRRAAELAAAVLAEGGRALDAVQQAVIHMEDDPQFNAGTGGALCADGSLELDASIMDGADLRAGAVCALPPYRNPVTVARAVLEQGTHVLYAGSGADAFARAHGLLPADPAAMVTERARAQLTRSLQQGRATLWSGGTVGAVARDRSGHVAAATSTGGLPGQAPGRVGDSPIIGAGTAADNRRGACSMTGDGDGILRVSVASDVLFRLAAGIAPVEAAQAAIAMLEGRVGALGGLIIAHPDGRLAHARTAETMAWGACQPGQVVCGC